MLNFVNIRNQFVTASFLGTGMAAVSALTKPCLAAAALPMPGMVVAPKCGFPSVCYCVESIPCRCHESGFCSATIEATSGDFDYNNSQCKVLFEMQWICAYGQSCSPPAGSSCANDDGCYPVGEPLPVYATRYFATSQGCQCDPV
ncbi:MAG: hypothetical protein BroJett003_09200 [Planctomycetota bacterium]|nr:MAG: hypothetical protein BroJett003_09200 [Planctomycetota bacterium]